MTKNSELVTSLKIEGNSIIGAGAMFYEWMYENGLEEDSSYEPNCLPVLLKTPMIREEIVALQKPAA